MTLNGGIYMTIRDILQRFYQLDAANGCTDADLHAMEAKFGKLPAVLTQFYQCCGGIGEKLSVQDTWIMPEDFRAQPALLEKPFLMLLNENQGVYCAAIRLGDLEQDDPPVFVSDDLGENWMPCADTLSDFLKAFLIYQAVFAFPCAAEDFSVLDADAFQNMQQRLTKFPFVVRNWFGTMHLFQDAPDSAAFALESDGEFQVLYGAVQAESARALAQKLDDLGEPM